MANLVKYTAEGRQIKGENGRTLMDDFDQTLQALKQGGRAMERDLPPAPAQA